MTDNGRNVKIELEFCEFAIFRLEAGLEKLKADFLGATSSFLSRHQNKVAMMVEMITVMIMIVKNGPET